MNKLIFLFYPITKKVRIVEYNSAYDHIHGKGKGWIYCTNYIPLGIALVMRAMNKRAFKNGNYSIDYNA